MSGIGATPVVAAWPYQMNVSNGWVVEEFVTGDGTDYLSVEQRVENVLEQLKVGRVELHFDDQTETCNIVTAKNGEIPPTDALR